MKTIYISDDGIQFADEQRCIEHENKLKDQKLNAVAESFKKNLTTKQFFQVDVDDVDEFLTEFLKSKGMTFKRRDRYECIVENEWGNYECHSFNVLPHAYVGELKDAATYELLDWACADGLIEPGNYLIQCFW